MVMQATIGSQIKTSRHGRELNLEELSQKTGVSASHIARIERGDRFPSARVLTKMSYSLGFEPAELLSLAGYLPTPNNICQIPQNGTYLDMFVDYERKIGVTDTVIATELISKANGLLGAN